MKYLEGASTFFQKTFGAISISTIDHRIILIGCALVVIVLIIYTQDKIKAMFILITIYAIWFLANLIPSLVNYYNKTVSLGDRFVINIIFGSLPLVALLVQKYKRGRSRSKSS